MCGRYTFFYSYSELPHWVGASPAQPGSAQRNRSVCTNILALRCNVDATGTWCPVVGVVGGSGGWRTDFISCRMESKSLLRRSAQNKKREVLLWQPKHFPDFSQKWTTANRTNGIRFNLEIVEFVFNCNFVFGCSGHWSLVQHTELMGSKSNLNYKWQINGRHG